jgi:glycosyltransferase involved in cell wall biosynthesis
VPFYRWLKVFRQMDTIFVYSTAQYDFACEELGIPRDTIRLISFHADHRFFRPMRDVASKASQVCAAGLEWRDYATLVRAVAETKSLFLRLAAASPWCKSSATELDPATLPAHISTGAYDYFDLRTLYAESSFVVVPLFQNDFQAGVTTILEAMAMGKAVIVTSTIGQTDVITHEENGLYVAPGDVAGLAAAIERLRHDSELRDRLGRSARRWVEEHATLDRWVADIVAGLRDSNSCEPHGPGYTPRVLESHVAEGESNFPFSFGALLASAQRLS